MTGWLWHPAWIYGMLAMTGVGLFAAMLFIYDYQRRVGWSWWRHQDGEPNLVGRWLMTWAVSRVLVLGLTLINWAAGMWPGVLPASFLVMAIFALHTFVPYRLLAKAQDRQRARAKEGKHDVHHRDAGDIRPQPGR